MIDIDKKAMEAKSEREQELQDLVKILQISEGKRFLSRILDRAGILQTSYGNGTNPQDFAFLEGRRDLGLFILGEITQANSEAWLEMQKDKFNQIKLLNEKVKHERNKRTSDNEH